MSDESARISGLGENNYLTRLGDPHSAFVNPAGLSTLKGKNIIGAFTDDFSGNILDGSACRTLKNIAFKVNYVNVPDIEGRDESGVKTDNINYNQFKASVSKGFYINDSLSLGLGLNAFSKFANGQSSLGLSVDAGAIYTGKKNYHLGAVVQNIGSQSSFNRNASSTSLPLTLRIGGDYMPVKNLILSSGFSFSGDTPFVWSAGAEYTPFKWIALRLGFDSAKKSYGMLSTGLGININDIYHIDYAFRAHPELGLTHGVSFSMRLKDKSKPEIIKQEKQPEKVAVQKEQIDPEQPIIPEEIMRIGLEEDKYLTITAGWGFFKFSRAEMGDLTDAGKRAVDNSKELIKFIYSLGLCDFDVEVTVEGNASDEGRDFMNDLYARERSIQGQRFLLETLDGVVDPGKLHIVGNPLSDTKSKVLEQEYICKWEEEHNGEPIPQKELDRFREGCRNFKIIIMINIEKWQEFRENKEVIDKINSLSANLGVKMEEAYQKALKLQEQK